MVGLAAGALLELHHHVEEGDLAPALGVQGLEVPRENVFVRLLLCWCQVCPITKRKCYTETNLREMGIENFSFFK